MSVNRIICIVGPTATGKSHLAVELAGLVNGEVVGADSRQIYCELNIGTAKPSLQERQAVVHHLIDCTGIGMPWSVADYVKAADRAVRHILEKNKVPILVGGTGMYIRHFLEGLDHIPAVDPQIRQKLKKRLVKEGLPELCRELNRLDPRASERLNPNDTQRILRALEVREGTGQSICDFWKTGQTGSDHVCVKFGLNIARDEIYWRINERVEKMFEQGLREEAKKLVLQYPNNPVLGNSIGYAEWIEFGFRDEKKVLETIQKNTRNFAKRQLTWFRGDEDISWFDPTRPDSVKKLASVIARSPPSCGG